MTDVAVDVAVSAAPGPVVEPPQSPASFLKLLSVKRIAKERRQSPQVVPTCLTED